MFVAAIAVAFGSGCTTAQQAQNAQAQAAHAEQAADQAQAAAASAQKAADAANAAADRAAKAVADANREITRVEHHLDELIPQIRRRFRHPRHRKISKHHHARKPVPPNDSE